MIKYEVIPKPGAKTVYPFTFQIKEGKFENFFIDILDIKCGNDKDWNGECEVEWEIHKYPSTIDEKFIKDNEKPLREVVLEISLNIIETAIQHAIEKEKQANGTE